jgi:D-serine deaminase-like pyridoxal phosphate-dependent protein
MSTWYSINNIDVLDSPALVIYPERVKQNIRTAIDMAGDVERLRPHIKTNKSAEATQLMIAAGINKFKCATIAEAEMLGICRAKDVLLAYQPTGPKLHRFTSLIQQYPGTVFSCITDSIPAAEQIAATALASGLTIPVYIDLNLGQNRTGIEPGNALPLYLTCSKLKGIKTVGLHAYDGHIRDIDFSTREQKCDDAFVPVEKLKKEIIQKGLDEPVIIAGGSPTFSIHSKRENRECSPGTFIYWDKGYIDLCPEQPFLPAALVITRVVSLPGVDTPLRICLDLGHKSIAAENELSKRVYFLNAPALKPVGQSEEHLVVEAGEGHSYKIGDVLYGLPVHICPTVALYERAYTVEDHLVNGEWRMIARDRKINV